MASFRVRFALVGLGTIALAVVAAGASQFPALGAGVLLHPLRRHVDAPPPAGCSEAKFSGIVARAFQLAEQQAHFNVDAVSPVAAAVKIAVPVLLIHGDADVDTPADHSRRVFAALREPKRLVLVPGATHNGSLRPEVWDQIERWVVDALERTSG